MKLKRILIIVTMLAVKSTAFAQESVAGERPNLEQGMYYALSPELAGQLNINYDQLVQALHLREGQGIVVKKNEETEGVDISIFDSHQFAQARMDFVRQ